ncbi:MAG TPA: hypothetical protein VGV13_11995 [Methylomirabilota bacterium]|jgi:threonine/homoserine/homoserine lactone efflux protein|nr:hypothetical protein [Methylomirabilota bacterium]
MIDAQVLTFALVAAALTLSPGADTMLVVRNVLRGGRHDGVVTTFGICSGLFVPPAADFSPRQAGHRAHLAGAAPISSSS